MSEQPGETIRRETGGWGTFRRKAGCLFGCLTEPLVLVVLALGTLIGWRLWGRKIRAGGDSGEHADDESAGR